MIIDRLFHMFGMSMPEHFTSTEIASSTSLVDKSVVTFVVWFITMVFLTAIVVAKEGIPSVRVLFDRGILFVA